MSAEAQSRLRIGVKALPRTPQSEHFPGHVGVSWKVGDGRVYRGFRFHITDLPDEYQAAEKWRDFLFDHAVPGYVEEDLMLRDAHQRRPKDLLCRDWRASAGQVERIEQKSVPGQRDFYCFNPVPAEGKHNCVTWAFSILNQTFLQEILPEVRDGRMKLAIEVLLERGAKPST
jgi:hypothetical protein